FLLQGSELNLAGKGFRMVTADDVMLFIDIPTSHRSIKTSIYSPMKRIVSFLQTVDVPPEDLAASKVAWPELFELDDNES
ncbi:hypothetical protein, partial [Achromobacter sp. GbtcB20]|uniref:hypothetical protein n=1 Tax=Achromobacter sp. GbtcB20 TaxID=2824765 RepID=UPI001C308B11